MMFAYFKNIFAKLYMYLRLYGWGKTYKGGVKGFFSYLAIWNIVCLSTLGSCRDGVGISLNADMSNLTTFGLGRFGHRRFHHAIFKGGRFGQIEIFDNFFNGEIPN